LQACATPSPIRLSRKYDQSGLAARAASSPPISPEVSVIGITPARVMMSHRETPSMRSSGRFIVSSASRQFLSRSVQLMGWGFTNSSMIQLLVEHTGVRRAAGQNNLLDRLRHH